MTMICPDCGNMIAYNSYFSAFYCPRCGGFFKKVKSMTNADRIRSMNNDELALWICGVYDIEEEHGKFINGIIIPGYAPHDIEEWLQQPAKETDSG